MSETYISSFFCSNGVRNLIPPFPWCHTLRRCHWSFLRSEAFIGWKRSRLHSAFIVKGCSYSSTLDTIFPGLRLVSFQRAQQVFVHALAMKVLVQRCDAIELYIWVCTYMMAWTLQVFRWSGHKNSIGATKCTQACHGGVLSMLLGRGTPSRKTGPRICWWILSCGAEGLAEVLAGVGPNWLGGERHRCMGQRSFILLRWFRGQHLSLNFHVYGGVAINELPLGM